MAKVKLELEKSSLYTKIDLQLLVEELINKKAFPKISNEAWAFAQKIMNHSVMHFRPDNFCINLCLPKENENKVVSLDEWSQEQCRAFAQLFVHFSDKAADLIKDLKEEENNTQEVQAIWLKLPEQNDRNREVVNKINQILLNRGFMDRTGDESGISLLRYLNTAKPCPIPRYSHTTQSISVVLVTETDKVLLLQRGGLSGRAGNWGVLTGKIDRGETKEAALKREVQEEISVLINEPIHYLGSLHTPQMGKDLVDKGRAISWSDDCSYVFGMRIPEHVLKNNIKLDSENSAWKLFTREELDVQFKSPHVPAIHGEQFDQEELHVARAKALLALDAAKSDFTHIEYRKFTYPYTNSHGFFAHAKPISLDMSQEKQFTKNY